MLGETAEMSAKIEVGIVEEMRMKDREVMREEAMLKLVAKIAARVCFGSREGGDEVLTGRESEEREEWRY